jgi:hypothetical protein
MWNISLSYKEIKPCFIWMRLANIPQPNHAEARDGPRAARLHLE